MTHTTSDGLPTYPWTITRGRGCALLYNGEPRLLVGGQVYNSSSSSLESVAVSFDRARQMNANAVLAPVSWALVEAVEGSFDFALVDQMLQEARANGLRLVLLWFGAFKNAASTYAPRWVRADRQRFPRARTAGKRAQAFSYDGATPKPVLSVFGDAVREADALAFEALLRHLSRVDDEGTVAMIQVENESGLLGDSRDRSELADEAWAAPVPEALLASLRDASADTSLARRLWEEHGSHTTGTWAQVFGDGADAEEVFMAWGFASYVEHLANRGRAIVPIPMYANAWLGPQPGQSEPGQWPSGGPASRVLDVWRSAAPSLALLGPDVYIDDADAAFRTYAAGEQPLFVPESRLNGGEFVRALGTYRAIGWSAFGIDGGNPEGQVAAVLGFVTALEAEVSRARQRNEITAVVIEAGEELRRVTVGEINIDARGTLALFQRMLLDAGVQVPEPELNLPNETTRLAPVPAPGDTRPFGLLFADGNDIVVIGQGLTLDFSAPAADVEIDVVDELLLADGDVVRGRTLNGDERLRIVPTDRVGAARIRLLRAD